MARGTVTVRVLGDARGLTRELDNASERLRRFGDRMSVTVTPALAALGAASVDAASDLQQSAGAIVSVFGSAASQIEQFGRSASQSLGLSRREVNETAAVLGASLQSMGFSADEAAQQVIGLQQRAADMAATFGGTTREALEAIASLMRGERDPIERFGVAIKQADVNARVLAEGLDTSTTEAERMAEATAALDLLMQQTGSTAGQFARESDTLAGATQRARAEFEDARAELGEALLPAMAGVASAASDLLGRFNELDDGTQQMILALSGIVAVAGPVLSVGGRMVGMFRELNIAATTARFGGIAVLGAGLAWLATNYINGQMAAAAFADEIAAGVGPEPAAQIAAYADELERLNEANTDWIRLDGWNPLSEGTERIQEVTERLADLRGEVEANAAEGAIFRDHQQALNFYLDEGYDYATALAAASVEMAQATMSAQGATSEWGQSLRDAEHAVSHADTSIGEANEELADMETEARDAAREVSTLRDRLDSLTGVGLGAVQANIRYAESLGQARTELSEGENDLSVMTEAGRENLGAILEMIGASQSLVLALEEQGATTIELEATLQQHRRNLEQVMEQAGFTEEQIADLIAEYHLTPDEIETAVFASGIQSTVEDLHRVREAMGEIGQTVEDVSARLSMRVSTGPLDGGILEGTGDGPGVFGAAMPPINITGGGGGGHGDGPGVGGLTTITTDVADIIIREMQGVAGLGPAAGVEAMMAALRVLFPGLRLYSGFRPGAITATGNQSYHALGRAVDIPPDMAVFNAIASSPVAPITKELIYSPAGARQLRNGRPHYYSGITRANHWDHIHWALQNGGIVRATAGGTSTILGEGGSDEAVIPLDRPLGVVIQGWATEDAVPILPDPGVTILRGVGNPHGHPDPGNAAAALAPLPRAASGAGIPNVARIVGRLFIVAENDANDELEQIAADRKRLYDQLGQAESSRDRQIASITASAERQAAQLRQARRDALNAYGLGGTAAGGPGGFILSSLLDPDADPLALGSGATTGSGSPLAMLLAGNADLREFARLLDELRGRGLSEDVIRLLGLDSPQQLALLRDLSDDSLAEIRDLNDAVADRFAITAGIVQHEADNMLGTLGASLAALHEQTVEALQAVADAFNETAAAIAATLDELAAANAAASSPTSGTSVTPPVQPGAAHQPGLSYPPAGGSGGGPIWHGGTNVFVDGQEVAAVTEQRWGLASLRVRSLAGT